MMTAYELARILDGADYQFDVLSERLEKEAKESELVVIYGYSDDLMELRGAIDDEFGCFDGGTAYLTKKGLLTEPECDCGSCPYYDSARKSAASVEAVWGNTGNPCWTYRTDITHEIFRIWDGSELFCMGIVLRLKDLPD